MFRGGGGCYDDKCFTQLVQFFMVLKVNLTSLTSGWGDEIIFLASIVFSESQKAVLASEVTD